MGGGEGEDGQALGHVVFQPVSQTRGGVSILFDQLGQPAFGFDVIVGVEHPPHVLGDLGLHVLPGHVSHGVVHQVELAALPGRPGKRGLPRGGEAGVIITDHQLHPVHAPIEQRLKELTPVDLGFAERGAATQHAAFAIGQHTDRGE